MKSKIFLTVSVAILAAVLCPPALLAKEPATLNSAPARAYYAFNTKIFNPRNMEEIYPMIPKGQVLYIKARTKEQQDNKAKWFRQYYLGRPQITAEVDGVLHDGPIADLTGYAYKWFNNRWARVDIFVRMQSEDNDWKFVSQRYEGQL
jgi:hypothetical protein